MIHLDPIDGLCPRCQVALVETKAEYEEGFTIYQGYFSCPQCDWQPGDTTVHGCDMCGEITDELVDYNGDEFCTKCHHQQTIAEWTQKIIAASLQVNTQSKFCAFVHYSGHVHVLDVYVTKSKADYNEHLASSSVNLHLPSAPAELERIWKTLFYIASFNELPEKLQPSQYGRTPEVMSA